jgi:hypothetical protein
MWLHQKDLPKHSQIWNQRPIAVAATIIPRVSRAVNENRVASVRLVLDVEWSIEVTKASHIVDESAWRMLMLFAS